MLEINEENLESPPVLPKRKPDLETLTPDPKKPKPEPPKNQIPEQESHEKSPSNGKSAIDKGKSVMKEDKGKGKLQVEESDSSSSSSEDEENEGEGEDGGDSDFLDDPLAEVDLSNILPSRTRRRAAQPGAYLVNDMDDEEDEDDDEDEEVVADEDDSD